MVSVNKLKPKPQLELVLDPRREEKISGEPT